MALSDLRPVNRDSTAAIIAEQLRSAIMNGGLPPGTQLTEADLAARFDVSRGPLREAMQRLVQEGLLRSERHRGLFVIELEPEDVRDIYRARLAIETAALELIFAAPDRRSAVAEDLADIHQGMLAAVLAGDPDAASAADVHFHEVLVGGSGSRRLARMAATLLVETRMCIAAMQRTYRFAQHQAAEHGAIVAAIRDGERALALELIDSHMRDAINRLVTDERPDWETVQ